MIHNQPISEVYSRFLSFARIALANGGLSESILGPPDCDVSPLLGKPDTEEQSQLSMWASQVVSAFSAMPLVVKMGCMYFAFKLMRVCKICLLGTVRAYSIAMVQNC